MVHSCKLQGHIKHEWEGYLGDVGQRCKAKNGEDHGLPPLRDKSVRAWLPKVDKYCLMAGQVLTLKGMCSSGTLMQAPRAYKA